MSESARLREIAAAICAHRGLSLGSEVGSGAFKHTYEVHTEGGEPRALKLYRRSGVDARTEREVDAITRCSHRAIARFETIDIWIDGADQYIFSLEEFLSGGTLTASVKSGPLAVLRLRSLARELVDAVGHIASLGLVHRDLKPDNIMFRTLGGQVVIVDFGLVRDLRQVSLTRTWLPHGPGTPYYAAPEQLNNEKSMLDWRADQFALGVVLAECGSGRHPYHLDGMDAFQVVERVARRESPSADFVAWATESDLLPLITMVAPWPIGRFRTPTKLAAAW